MLRALSIAAQAGHSNPHSGAHNIVQLIDVVSDHDHDGEDITRTHKAKLTHAGHTCKAHTRWHTYPPADTASPTTGNVYMVFEYCDHDLAGIMKHHRRM